MNTWAEGLKPTFQRLGEQHAQVFAMVMMAEIAGEPMPVNPDDEFLIKILNKRIEAMKLPISFTPHARAAVLCLAENPGQVVALLIDCLNKYEGQEVDCDKLAWLYPDGFYDRETFERYVDNYLRRSATNKVKWAEIYGG